MDDNDGEEDDLSLGWIALVTIALYLMWIA